MNIYFQHYHLNHFYHFHLNKHSNLCHMNIHNYFWFSIFLPLSHECILASLAILFLLYQSSIPKILRLLVVLGIYTSTLSKSTLTCIIVTLPASFAAERIHPCYVTSALSGHLPVTTCSIVLIMVSASWWYKNMFYIKSFIQCRLKRELNYVKFLWWLTPYQFEQDLNLQPTAFESRALPPCHSTDNNIGFSYTNLLNVNSELWQT